MINEFIFPSRVKQLSFFPYTFSHTIAITRTAIVTATFFITAANYSNDRHHDNHRSSFISFLLIGVSNVKSLTSIGLWLELCSNFFQLHFKKLVTHCLFHDNNDNHRLRFNIMSPDCGSVSKKYAHKHFSRNHIKNKVMILIYLSDLIKNILRN